MLNFNAVTSGATAASRDRMTMSQSAERLSLAEFRIYTHSGDVQSEIQLHRRLFTTRNAPLTPAIESLGLSDAPIVIVQGLRYSFYKALRSDQFFSNRFDLGLQGPDPTSPPAITASYGSHGSSNLIRHEGREYMLTPKSWFGLKFELAQGALIVAKFKDVSPFMTLSSKRRYQIDCPAGQQSALLLSFAFLLAASSTYRLAL